MEEQKKQNKKSQEETNKYYDSISSGYDELHFEEQEKKIKVILEELKLKLKKSDKLLDVGCGTCFSYKFFECDWYGTEPSINMLRSAKNYEEIKEKLFLGGAEDLGKNFSKNQFDVVICVSAAHHFKNWNTSIDNIKMVAKPEAHIIFSLLNCSDLEKHSKIVEENFSIYKKKWEKDLIIFARNKKFK